MAKELGVRCGDLRRSGSGGGGFVPLGRRPAGRLLRAAPLPLDYAGQYGYPPGGGGCHCTAPGQAFTFEEKQPFLAGTPGVYPLLEELAGKYLAQP